MRLGCRWEQFLKAQDWFFKEAPRKGSNYCGQSNLPGERYQVSSQFVGLVETQRADETGPQNEEWIVQEINSVADSSYIS